MNRSRGGASGKSGPYNRMSRVIENKLLNCIDLYRSDGLKDMSPMVLIDYCLKVDSSLRRMKRRQIELSLEKVLADFDSATPQEPES
jgi:ribosome biogenesis ATPase